MSDATSDGPSIEAQIARIDALTQTGRTNWFGLLAYLTFAFVTVLGVQDADFFVPTRQTQLPLVNVAIPTKSFFLFAPILGAALYAYLHLHIRKVSQALATAPAKISGTPLERHIKPWLLNDFILRRRGDAAIDRRPMEWLATLATLTLIWFAGPFVLGWTWVRSWPAHAEWITVLNGLCFVLASYTGFASWRNMRRDLAGKRYTTEFIDIPIDLAALGLTMLVLAFGWIKTESGTRPPENLRTTPLIEDLLTPEWWGAIHPANLVGVEFAALPPEEADHDAARARFREQWCDREGMDMTTCGRAIERWEEPTERVNRLRRRWCRKNEIPDDASCDTHFTEQDAAFIDDWTSFRERTIASLPKPDLKIADLRGADLQEASLTGVDLSGAQLDWVNARGLNLESARLACARPSAAKAGERLCATLTDADLGWAQMQGADLGEAQMQGADLGWAQMQGADLGEAQMQGASLRGAQMQGADLVEAQMQGASLLGAQMQGADLGEAQMQGASLRGAQMQGADLVEAQMQGANLLGAQMQGADLVLAQMQGAGLWHAQMQGANLTGAQMQGAILGEAQMQGAYLTRAQMQGAYLQEAQMQGAYLQEAQMQGADLGWAQMQGAGLWQAQMQSTAWAGATIGASLAHAVDMRGATGLSQSGLSPLIGDASTLLPEKLGDGTVPFVPSCWTSEPPGWGEFMAKPIHVFESEEDQRKKYLCDTPMKTGTPWPLDKPPPWEESGLSREDWLAQQPAPTNPVPLPEPWAQADD